jgi:hypothetical protein
VAIPDRVLALGEEFSDYILIDDSRNSVIINFEMEYFDILYREYKRLGYSVKHVTRFKSKDSMTCVFTKDS